MTFLCLGKNGDVISLLPILKTVPKSKLIISKEYSSVLERAPYVEPIIWDGHWQDLRGALIWAKQRFPNVIVPQIFGKDFPIAKQTPSFQLDQWLRAGYLDKWDTLPTILDRPPNAKAIVAKHFKPGERVILYADHSQSSPFSQKDELYKLLVDHFGAAYKVIRLSEIRCDNPLDLLALFDAADCLVTVETMMLHLSAASTIPTVALIADSPTRWKGSAWSKRFLAHIRYSDFNTRKAEIVQAVRRGLNKMPAPKLELVKMAHEFAYNPSIASHDGKTWTAYRYHPDKKSWRTEIALTNGEETWKLDVARFNDHSLEDMRLFTHRGRLHGSLTIAKDGDGASRSVCGYGEISFDGAKCYLLNLVIPKYGQNSFGGTEKNWVFFDHNDRLFCTYQNAPEHTVIELDKGVVIKEQKSKTPECGYGIVRGGTQSFPYQGQLLRFAHVLQRNERSDQWWTYHLACVLMESQPPFRITKISEHPILSGTEQYFHWRRYKPRCLLPYGAIASGDGWKVSVGVNDSACGIVTVTEKDLHI